MPPCPYVDSGELADRSMADMTLQLPVAILTPSSRNAIAQASRSLSLCPIFFFFLHRRVAG